MWRTLSEDAREAVRELCDGYGPHLYDYCRTELSSSDAELAVAGALLSAHARADRVDQSSLLRPWLYALARAHRTYLSTPTSVGSWSRPGRMSDLLPEALRALDAPHRELLDLSVRHGLTHGEIAAIFDVTPDEVETVVLEAADGLEEWFAAVIAARTRHGCPALESRVTDWASAPGRRTRARISRHIAHCDACRRAPRTMVADTLLRQMPIAPAPGTLHEQLAWALPLPGDDGLWRADGFPAQAHGLQREPVPPPLSPVPGPTTGTWESSGPAAGAAAAGPEHTPEPAAPRPTSKHARPGPPDQGPAAGEDAATGSLTGSRAGGRAGAGDGTGAASGADRSPDRSPEWAIVRRNRGGVPYRNLPAASVRDRSSSGPAGQERDPSRRAEGGPPWEHHPDDGPPWTGGTGAAAVPAQRRPAVPPPPAGRRLPTALPTDRHVAGTPRTPSKDRLILSAPIPGDELAVAPPRERPTLSPAARVPRPRPAPPGPARPAPAVSPRPERAAPPSALPAATGPDRRPVPRQADTPAWALGTRPAEPPRGLPAAGSVPFPSARRAEFGEIVDLHGGEEFWRNRPDDADPDTVLTVRAVARVGLLVGVGLLVAGLAWSGLNARQRMPVMNEVSAPGPAVTPAPQDRPSPGPAVAVPPPADAGTGAGPLTDTGPGRDTAQDRDAERGRDGAPSLAASPAPATPTPAPAREATERPAPAGTMSPASRKRAEPGAMTSNEAGQDREPRPTRQALPRPRPPVASLSQAAVRLGSRRTGTFALACRGGSCRVTSARGSSGIVVSGRTFRVKAPAALPGCAGPAVTRTGTILVRWTGVARGDGRATAGTATGGGTLRLRVTWTIARDPGTYMLSDEGGGTWTNCGRY
ncbi:hypothetical protein [Nonomuraea indica]|uniref:DNA-directed RNA polymerase specialized sigma subunit, sigma24 family n=1 Tax=Nonomuraea indica TaxID=1581193 RepID=A0ABW8A0L8_9ACTN